jgi:hypothetical protein
MILSYLPQTYPPGMILAVVTKRNLLISALIFRQDKTGFTGFYFSHFPDENGKDMSTDGVRLAKKLSKILPALG